MSVTNTAFPKTRRLCRQKDFDRIFQQAERKSRSGLTLRVLENGADCSRLGLMIGKKAGNAVTRNRVKRVLREIFRYKQASFTKNCDIVLTVYRKLRWKSNKEIRKTFLDLLYNMDVMDSVQKQT